MTAPDPRLDEIQARRSSEPCPRHRACYADDIAYLLAELRKAHEALERVEGVAAAWTERGEHDMAFSKTVPDEDIAMVLLTEGASMVENGRHIRNAIAGIREPIEASCPWCAEVHRTDLTCAAVAAAKGDERG